ncbi:MAG: VOC family protein [Ferruginibacter sp.]|nr:VOC family protein [Chitinophagaceae bacterium]
MSRPYKPIGYNSVSPYLIVNGAQKMIDLLKAVFNAEELRRFDRPDGTIMHAEIKVDDSVLMVGDASDAYPPNQHLLHIYVPDVDETFSKAISLGCVTEEAPQQREGDPDRRGSFKDFSGNSWAIGTQL